MNLNFQYLFCVQSILGISENELSADQKEELPSRCQGYSVSACGVDFGLVV